MKYANKLKLIKLSYTLLGIATLGVILIIAWLSDRLIETSISAILFYIYRPLYDKQYHSKTLPLCSLTSICVFAIVSQLEVDIATSILNTVIITFAITSISYFVRDFFDSKILIKKYKEKLDKFNCKSIENLTEEEMLKCMPKIRPEVINIVYGYLHRPKGLLAPGYAMKKHIGEATLYRYLKLVRETYESLDLKV